MKQIHTTKTVFRWVKTKQAKKSNDIRSDGGRWVRHRNIKISRQKCFSVNKKQLVRLEVFTEPTSSLHCTWILYIII